MVRYLDQDLQFQETEAMIKSKKCYLDREGIQVLFGITCGRADRLLQQVYLKHFFYEDIPHYRVGDQEFIEINGVLRRKSQLEFASSGDPQNPRSIGELIAQQAIHLQENGFVPDVIPILDRLAFKKSTDIAEVFLLYARDPKFRQYMDAQVSQFLRDSPTKKQMKEFTDYVKKALADDEEPWTQLEGQDPVLIKEAKKRKKKQTKTERLELIRERYRKVILEPKAEIAREMRLAPLKRDDKD